MPQGCLPSVFIKLQTHLMSNSTIKVVGIGGAHTNFSTSYMALNIALKAAQAKGASIKSFNVGELDLPFYDNRNKEIPVHALAYCEAVHQADAIILCSPLYHGTVSGAFKNAIDWLEVLSKYEPRYLSNKMVGLICTAGGSQGLQAINTMEYMVRSLRGFTVPFVAPIARAWNVFNKDGQVTDEATNKQLVLLGQEVVKAAIRFKK